MVKLVWVGGEQVPGTRCEDAPCCGCCGPGSDDPAYQPEEAPEPMDLEYYDQEFDDGFDGPPDEDDDEEVDDDYLEEE